jgi:hypothetical protein
MPSTGEGRPLVDGDSSVASNKKAAGLPRRLVFQVMVE